MNPSLRARNRYGMGARIDEKDLADPRGWLRQQVTRDAVLQEREGLPTAAEIGTANRALIDAQRSREEVALREARERIRAIARAEGAAALGARVTSETPFAERLVAFWCNHLCVAIPAKPPIASLAGLYEREVIRTHVFGRYEDMVLASARHPAMLVYLDNASSIGPGSAAARGAARRGREHGLNENYARELLELHTLGVDGGYDQADVEALARILTGWTVAGFGFAERLTRGRGGRDRSGSGSDAVGFQFVDLMHEPGAKDLLGERYGEAGEEEGERAIAALCRHPSTARFVSTKLVRHFVADDPPPDAVERVERRWIETEGDLAEVAIALVELEHGWDPAHVKFRAPQDWLVAMLRAVGARDVPEPIGRLLQQLRQPLWAPGSPKGYGDAKSDWADPDSLLNRAELARTAASRIGRSVSLPARFLGVMDVDASDPLVRLLKDGSIDPSERVALALGGPSFQWR